MEDNKPELDWAQQLVVKDATIDLLRKMITEKDKIILEYQKMLFQQLTKKESNMFGPSWEP